MSTTAAPPRSDDRPYDTARVGERRTGYAPSARCHQRGQAEAWCRVKPGCPTPRRVSEWVAATFQSETTGGGTVFDLS